MIRALVAILLLTSTVEADDRCKKLDEKAAESFGRGEFMRAFIDYEKAYKCEASEKRLVMTIYAACKANNEPAVKRYLVKLPAEKRAQVYALCKGTCRGMFDSDKP